MGHKYTVEVYTPWDTDDWRPLGETHRYIAYYGSQHLLPALWKALKASRHYGCVRLEIR